MKYNKLKKAVAIGLVATFCMGGAITSNIPVIDSLIKPAYADTIKDSAFSATGVINSNVSMRPGPGTSYKRLDALKKGTKVEIVAKTSNNWYKIKYKDGYAYVYNTYVTLDKDNQKDSKKFVNYTATGTTTANLSVRISPSTSAKKLGTLKKGTQVNIVAKSSNWYRIEYKKGYSYVSAKYVTIKNNNNNKEVAYTATGTTTTNLTVRKTASTSSTKLGTLKKGTKVNIVAKTSYWYKIKYKDGYAYVSNKYITINSPEKPDVKEVQGVINHDVYVREAGSPTAKKIGVLTKGTKVNLLEKTKNGWYKINYKGKTGYFYGQYVDVTTLQETNY